MAEPKKYGGGVRFDKGNQASKGNKGGQARHYVSRCRAFAEAKGWAILERWATSRKNPKAALAALRTILEYGYGRPREQVKLDVGVSLSLQALLIRMHSAGGDPEYRRPGELAGPGAGDSARPQLPEPQPGASGVVRK